MQEATISKGGGTTTSTGNSEPWTGVQPYLKQGFSEASRLYGQGGPQYYSGNTYAGPTDTQLQGISAQANLGMNGTPVANAAQGATTDILSPDFQSANPGNATYNAAAQGGLNSNTGSYFAPIASGQYSNTAGVSPLSAIASGNLSNGQGQDVLNYASQGGLQNTLGQAALGGLAFGNTQNMWGTPTLSRAASGGLNNYAGVQPLSQFASGNISNQAATPTLSNIAGGGANNQPGMDVLSQIAHGSNLSADNPYFSQMANTIAAKVLPSIDAPFAAANRGNSGLANRARSEGLGDAIGGLAYQNYQQGLEQQQSAAGQLAGLGQQNTANQLNAAMGLGNFQQGNLANQLGAAGQLSNIGAQNISNQLGAAGTLGQLGQGNLGIQANAAGQLANVGAQDIGNQLGAANSLGQFGQQNIGNILNASGQLSGIGQNNIGNMLAAAQGLTGVQQGNASTMLQGAGGLSGNYNNAIGQQLSAAGLAPSLNNLSYQQAGALTDAGTQQQTLAQQAINDAVQRWNYQQQLPYQNLNNFIAQIQGNYGGTTNQTQTSPGDGGAATISGIGSLGMAAAIF